MVDYRQAKLMQRLAASAIDLKVGNGWYGDEAQGDSTFEEDAKALEEFEAQHALGKTVWEEGFALVSPRSREDETAQTAEEFSRRLALCHVTAERARIATNFYGHVQDGDLEGMVHELGELDGTIKLND